VWSETDPLTGGGRDAVYIDGADAAELGLADGAPVRLVSDVGAMDGHLRVVRLPRRSLQVHWPEGNRLIASSSERREPHSHIPDYNAVVRLEPR
jgi:anaerobic selenocysteine-containing dehydrogenase